MKARKSSLINFNPLKILAAICSDGSPGPPRKDLAAARGPRQACGGRAAGKGQLGERRVGMGPPTAVPRLSCATWGCSQEAGAGWVHSPPTLCAPALQVGCPPFLEGEGSARPQASSR